MTLSVLIAVTHLLGVGHLSRAAAIGRALAQRGHRVTLASGGPPAPLVPVSGLRMVQLPPVRTAAGDFRTLLDETGQPVGPERLELRRALLATEIERDPPDILLTELFPFGRRGLAHEFLAAIDAVKRRNPRALVACSVRDILVAPERPEKLAQTHARLREHYDAILVHGDPALVPLSASWPLYPGLEDRVHYTGYVDSYQDAPVSTAGVCEGGSIVVSGGGSAAGLPLFEAALDAATLIPEHPWLILAGSGVEGARLEALRSRAPPHVTVERARADFRRLLRSSRLSVSQAGYNTVVDTLVTGVRAVLVPYEQGQETEQRRRADLLAARGWATVLPEAELFGDRLAGAVRAALARPRPAVASLPVDGAEQSARVLERLAAAKTRVGKPSLVSARGNGWSILAEALERAEDAGVTIPFWWRDDDAVAHTPELDRLIATARRLSCPLALAAIPARTDRSLSTRVADEPGLRILVHGWSHANHAPSGAKKAEFGPDRSFAEARRDAARALSRAKTLFGPKLTPVFVPPWNRIAPAFAAHLPSLGYAAVSTFGAPKDDADLALVPQVQTHIDPIAWRGSGGLDDPDRLLATLAAGIAARTESAGTPEPIGLLTHHLASTAAVWDFCERLIEAFGAGSAIRAVSIDGLVTCPSDSRSSMASAAGDGLEMVAEDMS